MTATALHVQVRAHPLHHLGFTSDEAEVELPLADGSRLRARRSSLSTAVYAPWATYDVDLTDRYLTLGEVAGTSVRWARLRLLEPGIALLALALDHRTPPTAGSLHEFASRDHELDRVWRQRDHALLEDVLGAVVGAPGSGAPRPSLLQQPWPSVSWTPADGAGAVLTRRASHYNAHLVAPTWPWDVGQDGTVPSVDDTCRLLLPYTFAWRGDPHGSPGEVLGLLEPIDLALAQRTVLTGADGDAVEILEDLSSQDHPEADPRLLRRHVDRIRSTTRRLATYRVDSEQSARQRHLAAQHALDLAAEHESTERLLGQVVESLKAESDARTVALDNKLNRLAAILAVATGGLLVIDVIEFLRGSEPLPPDTRIAVIVLLATATAALLLWLFQSTTDDG